MEIVLVGLNHRTAPVEVRERVSFTVEQAQQAATELRERGILEETLVLSTCNRSEVYGVPPEDVRQSAGALATYLSSFHSVTPEALGPSLYHHYDREAVRHLFRVSSGLPIPLLAVLGVLWVARRAASAFLPVSIPCSSAKPKFSARSARPIARRMATAAPAQY